jgi:hypothetical protein
MGYEVPKGKVWYIQCVRKVAVHLNKVLEVISTNVYTGLK